LYKTFEELPLVNTGCDSYASWHPDFKELSPTYEIDALVDKMLDLIPDRKWTNRTGNDTHLVITGGEPLLGWQRTYQDLFDHDHMRGIKNVTFETNGTQKLQPKFKTYLNEWLAGHNELTFSVSPKLSASGEVWDEAIKPEVVAEYQEVGTVYLKFVIDSEVHFEEVDRAVTEYREAGFTGVVYVMPQGGVVAPYAENRVNVADWALARGYYYTPRLHVDLWGNGWGK
jgi:7-carboxy-7-deazaguanine synthase